MDLLKELHSMEINSSPFAVYDIYRATCRNESQRKD